MSIFNSYSNFILLLSQYSDLETYRTDYGHLASILLPELFAMLSSDLFLLLSLLTCLLDEKVPKVLPYVFQIAALSGFGHLMVSRMFLGDFDETMRFWYNLFYLGVALATVVAVNIYLAMVRKDWTIARLWSAAVTFPTTLISMVSTYSYGYLEGATLPPLLLPILLIFSLSLLTVTTGVLLSPRLLNRSRRR